MPLTLLLKRYINDEYERVDALSIVTTLGSFIMSYSYQESCNAGKLARHTPAPDELQVKAGKKKRGGPWKLEYTGNLGIKRTNRANDIWLEWGPGYKSERVLREAYNLYRRKWAFYDWRMVDLKGTVLASQILTEAERDQLRTGFHPDNLKAA